jgi:hypothetical protein
MWVAVYCGPNGINHLTTQQALLLDTHNLLLLAMTTFDSMLKSVRFERDVLCYNL